MRSLHDKIEKQYRTILDIGSNEEIGNTINKANRMIISSRCSPVYKMRMIDRLIVWKEKRKEEDEKRVKQERVDKLVARFISKLKGLVQARRSKRTTVIMNGLRNNTFMLGSKKGRMRSILKRSLARIPSVNEMMQKNEEEGESNKQQAVLDESKNNGSDIKSMSHLSIDQNYKKNFTLVVNLIHMTPSTSPRQVTPPAIEAAIEKGMQTPNNQSLIHTGTGSPFDSPIRRNSPGHLSEVIRTATSNPTSPRNSNASLKQRQRQIISNSIGPITMKHRRNNSEFAKLKISLENEQDNLNSSRLKQQKCKSQEQRIFEQERVTLQQEARFRQEQLERAFKGYRIEDPKAVNSKPIRRFIQLKTFRVKQNKRKFFYEVN